MRMLKLTDTKLRALKPKEKPYQVADGQGLVVEVRPGGALAWVYRYRWNGRPQAVRLGRYPEITLQEAREKRFEAARLRAQGKSPSAEKQAAKQALNARATVEDLYKRYFDDVVQRDRKNPEEIERYFRREILPTLGRTAVADVTPQQILRITDRMKARSVPMAALSVRNLLKRTFDYAIARQIITFNPAAVIPAKTVAVPRSRERALSQPEIRTFLTTLYQADVVRRYKLALHLILLTLVRKGELQRASWREIDLENSVWSIPAENNKVGKPKIVYLSRQAAALFEELKSMGSGSDWVLPGRNNPRQPVSHTVLNSMVRCVDFKIDHFTIHDLRRTASTHLHEMGWNSDVIEKALGHEIGGVRGIYNRAEYSDQRRQMLQVWADWIDRVMTESKVIQGNFGRAA